MGVTVSLVTPCLDRREFVARAVDSARAQLRPGDEHIVIDGGSRDGTLDVLARYPHLSVLSEPDRGLYDALNKGVARARGDVVGFLNTDDEILPGALDAVHVGFARHPRADAVCGGIEIDAGAKTRAIGTPDMKRLRLEDLVSAQTLINARFFRRDVFNRIGDFEPRWRRCADRLFLARFALAGMRTEPLEETLYRYTEHAGSLTFSPCGPTADLFEEMLSLCEDELRKPLAAPARAFFLRWHGWVAGYLAMDDMKRGRPAAAAGRLSRAARQSALWPLAFLKHSAWHLSRRREWR